jgi:hypothetical protein
MDKVAAALGEANVYGALATLRHAARAGQQQGALACGGGPKRAALSGWWWLLAWRNRPAVDFLLALCSRAHAMLLCLVAQPKVSDTAKWNFGRVLPLQAWCRAGRSLKPSWTLGSAACWSRQSMPAAGAPPCPPPCANMTGGCPALACWLLWCTLSVQPIGKSRYRFMQWCAAALRSSTRPRVLAVNLPGCSLQAGRRAQL